MNILDLPNDILEKIGNESKNFYITKGKYNYYYIYY